MVVIRRMVDRHRAYTAIMLPGEPPQIFPTTDQEHSRVLQIYKQDRPHQGIHNDFSDYGIGAQSLPAMLPPFSQKNPPAPATGLSGAGTSPAAG
ncbi:MAG: hypothetical protein RL077_1488 [Verrucomicrobiota bacterium]|jgi:hypothetical protein